MTRTWRLIVRVALLATAVGVASCNAGPATTRLSYADSGRTIELRTGDEVVIALEGNPSTGFDWDLTATPAPTVQLVERTVIPQSSLAGAAATIGLRFRAVSPGQTRMALSYWRRWESVPPQRTFALAINVLAR